MGFFGEMYFSSESYKIALDINERVKRVYRILGPNQVISFANAAQITPDVRWMQEKIAYLHKKVQECSSRVQYIKVPTPDGYEVPVAMYVVNMQRELDLMDQDLQNLGY